MCDTVARVNNEHSSLSPVDLGRHIVLAVLLGSLVAVSYYLVDRPAITWAQGLDPKIIKLFKKITVFGSSGPYLISLAVLYPVLRFYKRWGTAAKQALFVFAAIAVSGLTVDLIKPIVARWRPKAFLTDPSHYGFAFFKVGYEHNSFPSGHATTAWAVACALMLLFPRLRVLWIGAATVVAASRVIVGAHYPGDVLAGAWFGVVITLALSRTGWFHDAVEVPRV